jgi:hypothetical protein
MRFIKEDIGKNDADCAEDAVRSTVLLEQRIDAILDRVRELPADAEMEKASLNVDAATLLLDLERGKESWDLARAALEPLLAHQQWELAAQACLILFQADQPESMAALGHAIWLSVTFPMDPELTVAILQQVVDETPDDSDGAAVAAVVAHYVADMRAQGKQRDDLLFFTNNLIGAVARRHGDVSTQEKFDAWFERLELNDPEKFLVRLRNIVDVMVQDDWWIDRDALHAQLPVS